MLDEVCDRIRELSNSGKTRADVSLGIIQSQRVADRLKEAGVECYGHNLETSKRFFPSQCTHAHLRRSCANHFLFEKGRGENLFRRHHRHGRNAGGPM